MIIVHTYLIPITIIFSNQRKNSSRTKWQLVIVFSRISVQCLYRIWNVSLNFNISTCLLIYLSIHWSIHPSIICPSIHPSYVHLSIYLSIHPSIHYLYHSSIHYLSIYLSIHPSIYSSIHSSINLSPYTYIYIHTHTYIYIYIHIYIIVIWYLISHNLSSWSFVCSNKGGFRRWSGTRWRRFRWFILIRRFPCSRCDMDRRYWKWFLRWEGSSWTHRDTRWPKKEE